MKRYNFCEIADKPWFPSVFRDLMTDILQFVVVRFRIYEPVIPLIKEVMQHMKTNQIVDLCSGATGPWNQIQAQLSGEPGRQDASICVTLTDKYPNIEAFKKTKERFGSIINFIPEAVDVTDVPRDLEGMRTIFCAFHHFEPDAAIKILQNTVNSHRAIGVFEFTERRLDKLVFTLLTPLIVLFTVPFIKPVTFKRFFWVYIIPVIPWVLTYDAFVSYLKTYSPQDLKELTDGVNANGYVWKIDKIASNMNPMKITYLLGFPQNA